MHRLGCKFRSNRCRLGHIPRCPKDKVHDSVLWQHENFDRHFFVRRRRVFLRALALIWPKRHRDVCDSSFTSSPSWNIPNLTRFVRIRGKGCSVSQAGSWVAQCSKIKLQASALWIETFGSNRLSAYELMLSLSMLFLPTVLDNLLNAV